MKRINRFYCLTFKQIFDIAWDCIIKVQDDDDFSTTWLRTKIMIKEKENEAKKE